MQEYVRFAIVGFVAGILGASLVLLISNAGDSQADEEAISNNRQSELLERIAALEEQIAIRLPAPTAELLQNPDLEQGAEGYSSPPTAAAVPEQLRAEQYAMSRQRSQARLTEMLSAAGWTETEIESLEQLQDAEGLENDRRTYEQMRKRLEENPALIDRFRQTNVVRETFGEERYDEYLKAIGRPTALTVNRVLRGSAGETAGLQPGDLIRRYGSERIYNETDLMIATLTGDPGEAVSLEVERDGAIFHVSVPRGPLGTSEHSRRFIYR